MQNNDEKYKLKKEDPFSSHSKIISIMEDKPRSLSILDVGCASGFLAKELKDKGFKDITGIEPDKNAAAKARQYCKKIIDSDIESAAIKGGFDVIIIADVLEHLKDPSSALVRLKKSAKKDTEFLISVPNIANIYVRLSLLFGRFNYSNRGILDSTHLRFFTLRSFKRLMSDSGLETIKVYATPIPLPLMIPWAGKGKIFFFIHYLNNLAMKVWKTLLGYQFIAVARVKK